MLNKALRVTDKSQLPGAYFEVSRVFENPIDPKKTFRRELGSKIEYMILSAREPGKQFAYFKGIDFITDYTHTLSEIVVKIESFLADLVRRQKDMVSNSSDENLEHGYQYYTDAIHAMEVVKNFVEEAAYKEALIESDR